jgi:hypothetical protein
MVAKNKSTADVDEVWKRIYDAMRREFRCPRGMCVCPSFHTHYGWRNCAELRQRAQRLAMEIGE